MITLYDYLKANENDFDTYDTKYDAVVTVCYIDEEYEEEFDEYDKFCNNIIKKVHVVKIYGENLTVNWSELIERNIIKFKAFTSKYWKYKYEDDYDEFIYQWINEINLYMAGYVSEDIYAILNDFVDALE